MLRDFWSGQYRWPNDSKGYIFLARAVQEIGRALHGDAWSGAEFTKEVPIILPRQLSQRLGERLDARNLLRSNRPDIELQPTTTGNKHMLPTAPITQEQWDIARGISLEMYKAVEPALMRRASVMREVAVRCEASDLLSAYRAVAGGTVQAIPAFWWNTENIYSRFTMCQLNPYDPFGLGFSGERFAWIFLTQDSLQRYFASQPGTAIPEVESHVSPYMRVMLAVARNLKITPEHQPKKEEVIIALRNAWTGSAPLSEKLIETMATLMREPESQLGRARKIDKKSETR